jgi:hypothetical protein
MSAVTSCFETLEPAVDPNNRITFLLDWELTMKKYQLGEYSAIPTTDLLSKTHRPN